MQQSNSHQATFRFKPLKESDFDFLYTWFMQSYVAELWKEPHDINEFKKHYRKKIALPNDFHFLACIDAKPIGYIQYHRISEYDRNIYKEILMPEGSIGLDLFIGDPNYLNKGYGTKLMIDFIAFAQQREPKCTTIFIDPAPDNHRAIACYKKVGFETLGIFTVPHGPRGDGPGEIMLMKYRTYKH